MGSGYYKVIVSPTLTGPLGRWMGKSFMFMLRRRRWEKGLMDIKRGTQ